jgi:predicted N-acetyltransferase YhbS
MNPVIERATKADAEAIHKVIQIAFRREAERVHHTDIPPLRETVEELRAAMETCAVFAVKLEGQIVGTGRAIKKGETTVVSRLAVLPEHQRKGIASRLIQAIEAAYPETPRCEVFTSQTSLDNIALYEKHGYRIYDHRSAPAPDPTVFVFMQKFRDAAK